MAARTFDGFLLESGVFADAALAQAKRDAAASGVPLWRHVMESKGIAPDALTERYALWLKVPRLRLATPPPSVAANPIEIEDAIQEAYARDAAAAPDVRAVTVR